MIVIGRGLGLAIAQEVALKLKETSGIQAEAFSSAEVRHGPMELIGEDYPLLVFAPRGPEQAGLIQLARDMRARGARVLLAASANVPEAALLLVETAHFALDPIAAILSFYLMADALPHAGAIPTRRAIWPKSPKPVNRESSDAPCRGVPVELFP